MYTNEESKQSHDYSYLAFEDYLAARRLLLDKYCFPGITLASTAVEKYLKSILILKGKKNYNHLDKLSKFYSQLTSVGIDTEMLDERFMNLLSRAYSLRYFDKIESTDSFGFFINQVLAELDWTVNLLARMTTKIDTSGNIAPTLYQTSMNNKDHPMHINNFISMGIQKKEFMEKPSDGYAIHVKGNGEIYTLEVKQVISKYQGQINLITLQN